MATFTAWVVRDDGYPIVASTFEPAPEWLSTFGLYREIVTDGPRHPRGDRTVEIGSCSLVTLCESQAQLNEWISAYILAEEAARSQGAE